MTSLAVNDFESFHKAVHGFRPFDWQSELVRQVYDSGRWPDLVDLPTGAGKTSLIDIAVFLLALDAGRPPTERRFARRIVMIVDRRTIVDQAADRGRLLRTKLTRPDGPPLAAVADRLRKLFGGKSAQPPLIAGVLRGGIIRDDSWAYRPDMPAVIASTVDQVGSRLLFRGYGVSARMRPIHAGLLGNDTLFLLDEVHLSQPFAGTLQRLGAYRNWAEYAIATPWQVVELSATPGRTGSDRQRFPRSREVIDNDPALAPRLDAKKSTILRLIKGAADEARNRRQLAESAVDEVDRLIAHDHVRAVAVVVNRVQTATATAKLLAKRDGLDVVLLTGRMRPYDRDNVIDTWCGRIATGRNRTGQEPRLVVVATQCIEAGADFDFDGLVTECASLDALRQRFGRVDRTGQLHANGTPSINTVIATSTQVAPDARDFVYGEALAQTWRWLQEHEPVDFGVRRLPSPDVEMRDGLLPPVDRAPVLFPAHLDAWVQTRPGPQADPDPALWLHGLERTASNDVYVVWRADLTEAFLRERDADGDNGGDDRRSLAVDLVAACPPVPDEALALPINACRRWLSRGPSEEVQIADVDGVAPSAEEDRREPLVRPVLQWTSDGGKVVDRPGSIQRGDTLVVPAAYGGLTLQSWDPSSTKPVSDLGHLGQYQRRSRAVLRLVPPLFPSLESGDLPAPRDDPDAEQSDVRAWLSAHRKELPERDWPAVDHLVANGTTINVITVLAPVFTYDENAGGWEAAANQSPRPVFVVAAQQPVPRDPRDNPTDLDLPDVEDDITQFVGGQVPLSDHLHAVGTMARQLGTSCGVPDELAGDLAVAGRLHDLGKADSRFQVILHGDELSAAVADDLLAKSGMSEARKRDRDRVHRMSGYPSGMRHEILSVAMIQDHRVLDDAHDRDLVLHLVGSHHGWCRPYAPPVVDRHPVWATAVLDGEKYESSSEHGLAGLDSGVADRFWRLVRRYGWHGLAWFEAILRLADHRCSEEHERASVKGS